MRGLAAGSACVQFLFTKTRPKNKYKKVFTQLYGQTAQGPRHSVYGLFRTFAAHDLCSLCSQLARHETLAAHTRHMATPGASLMSAWLSGGGRKRALVPDNLEALPSDELVQLVKDLAAERDVCFPSPGTAKSLFAA